MAGFCGVAQPQGTVEHGVQGAPGAGKATVAVCEDAFNPLLLIKPLSLGSGYAKSSSLSEERATKIETII